MEYRLSRRRTVVRAVAALLWIASIAGLALTQTGKQRAAQKEFGSLPDLMRNGVHEQFTVLSFTIYHDAPVDGAKMDRVAKSASKLIDLAGRIPAFKAVYLGAGMTEEGATLESKAAVLAEAARGLMLAAQKKDAGELEPLLVKLEAACNSCHSKFRKELSIESQ